MKEHYYIEKPECEYREHRIKASIKGFDLTLRSASGVFSATEIDKGSRLLAESADLPKKGRILDFGCGYGVVGIVAALASPNSEVVLSDVNERAVELASHNIVLNKAFNAEAVHSDLFSKIEGKFDAILLNPPQTAGKVVCVEMIKQSLEHLKKGGSLQIVVRRNKGGRYLFALMDELFSKTKAVAKKSGYWVYKGVK